MAWFSYRDLRFAYSSKHSGQAVVFLHGFLESKEMWEELRDRLPVSYRKIALDLPGHGESANLGYVHSMEDMAELVKALVDKLKLRRFFLCGHSMGGYVALAFAEKYPEMIKGLLLLNSTARADSGERKLNRDRAMEVAKRDHKTYIRTSIPMLFRPKNRRTMKEAVNRVKELALKTTLQGTLAALEGMKQRTDREVLLHFAPYPILMVGGKHDPVIPLADLEEQLKGHKVDGHLLENGHMSHIEDLEELLPIIKAFLKKHG